MNPSEPEQPDKDADFPQSAEEEFETTDYRHFNSSSCLNLEDTYLTKRILDRKSLILMNWRQLSELEALTLAHFIGDLTVWFENDVAPELQMHLCRILAEHRGMLLLIGDVRLTEDVATALLQHPGPIVIDVKLDFHTAFILGKRLDIQIISDWWEP
ncbi:MAG TPA: hypothetical protein VMB22_00125 [Verrucomicrobiae bacterium]|nr:hypothetical protein [Verrucomicrobiae bacterium]